MQATYQYTMTIGLTTKHGEQLSEQPVLAIVASYLPGFSAALQTGYWEGTAERSLAITLVDTDGQAADLMPRLAARLAATFEQSTVLLTKQPVAYQFIEASVQPMEEAGEQATG